MFETEWYIDERVEVRKESLLDALRQQKGSVIDQNGEVLKTQCSYTFFLRFGCSRLTKREEVFLTQPAPQDLWS